VVSRNFGTPLSEARFMARKPVYGLHRATNQARTTFNGKRIYLGPYGSPKSHRSLDEVIAQWEAAEAGRVAPVVSKLSIGRLAILFLEQATVEYSRNGKLTGDHYNSRQALRSLTRLFSVCRVVDFGPRKLKLLQKSLVDESIP